MAKKEKSSKPPKAPKSTPKKKETGKHIKVNKADLKPKEEKQEKDIVIAYTKTTNDFIKTVLEDELAAIIICGTVHDKYYVARLIRKKGTNRNIASSRGASLPDFIEVNMDYFKEVLEKEIVSQQTLK